MECKTMYIEDIKTPEDLISYLKENHDKVFERLDNDPLVDNYDPDDYDDILEEYRYIQENIIEVNEECSGNVYTTIYLFKPLNVHFKVVKVVGKWSTEVSEISLVKKVV